MFTLVNSQFSRAMLVFILTFLMVMNVNATTKKWPEFKNEYLYTVSNDPTGNSVIGYRVSKDGTLTELPGSPFATGGTGTGLENFSDHGIIASPDGRFLFVTNPGSNDVSIMKVTRRGALRSLPNSPYATGGLMPTSLALSGNILYVSHIGEFNIPIGSCEECDYRGFRFHPRGVLKPIKGSVVTLNQTPTSQPMSIVFNEAGDTLVGTRLTGGSSNGAPIFNPLESFKLNKSTGLLTPAPGSPYESASSQPIGTSFNPINDSQLFVANVVELFVQPGTVSSYLVAQTGQIEPINNAISASVDAEDDAQLSTCWLDVTSDGRYLFATNTRSGSVSRYDVAIDGSLTLKGITDLPLFLKDGELQEDTPLEITLSNDDKYAYVVTEDANVVVMAQTKGNLKVIQRRPLVDIIHPYGLAFVQR